MSGRGEILEFLAGENVDSNQMDLGVAMLAGLGGGHVHNLARASLDHDVAVLAQSRALHRVRRRGAGIGRFKSVLMLEIEVLAPWGPGLPAREDCNER